MLNTFFISCFFPCLLVITTDTHSDSNKLFNFHFDSNSEKKHTWPPLLDAGVLLAFSGLISEEADRSHFERQHINPEETSIMN